MSNPNETCDEKTAKVLKEQTEKYRALMNDDQTQELVTTFLKQTAEFISCGPDCQDTKKKNEALRKYQQAQMSLFDGPVALEDTSKTYYTVSKGEDYAQKFSEEKLRDVANKIGDTYLEVFDELANASHSLSNLHESNLINYRNSQTLASHYTAQTEEVEDLLSDTQNEASTNDRKTYYENQEIETLRLWYRWYYYIYIIIVITFALSMFLVKSEVPFRRQVYILIIMILWFFFGDKAIVYVVNVIKKIIGFIPKNVYLSL